ncbi:putative nucleotidyltransferase with HDIG domain [Natranaerovirga pectinivora]|uniref:Putative nucleotidyltransferase with HDIG domain n=1 Tax=Natranaerovirga pectinivora TaxID=682400 RepID=A0A4R3MKI1_9FIRM|nr:HD domain-containing protein [Natranaerovirga pectinivora]TCT14331.1 putative nucleotidyltransferase with HDIG domain [Natranaerovirga pectinivora]
MDLKQHFLDFEEHLLKDEKPSIYFNELVNTHKFPKEKPFSSMLSLKETEQNLVHHPEGNVWNHTMLVVDYAAIVKRHSENPKVFMWGAFLHDIGKSTTTKVRKGKITSYDHDKEGEILAEAFLRSFSNDESFINGVKKICRWHMQPLFIAKQLPFADIKGMIGEVKASEIGLFSICDRLGRGKLTSAKIEEQMKAVITFLDKAKKYSQEDEKIEQIIEIIKNFNVEN